MGYVLDGEIGSAASAWKGKFEPSRNAGRLVVGGALLVLGGLAGLWIGAFGWLALVAREPWFLAPIVPACPLALVVGRLGARLRAGRPLPGGLAVAAMLAAGLVPFIGGLLVVAYLTLAVVTTTISMP